MYRSRTGLRPVRIDCRDFTDGSKTHLTVTNRAGRHREPCGLSLVDLFGRVVLRSIAVHGVADEEKIKALLRPLFDTYRRDRLYMPVEVEVVG
jgi:hypothetical protein